MRDFALPAPTLVRVANPAGFLAQKILIHHMRRADDRAKDILYVHDTLQVFGSCLDDLRNEWRERVRPCLHPKAVGTVETAHSWIFGELTDAIRLAAAIAPARKLTPEALRESCQYGLQQIIS